MVPQRSLPALAPTCFPPAPMRPQLLRLLCAYLAALALSPLARLALNRWTALLSALGSSMATLALALAFAPLASWQRRRGVQRTSGRRL